MLGTIHNFSVQIDCHAEDMLGTLNLNQKVIEDLFDQINQFLDERLEQFRKGFQKLFQGYSPELFSDLLYVQNIKIPSSYKM